MQNSVFLQLGQNGAVLGSGRIVGQVGKSGDHWLIEYFGKPTYRRVFPLAAIENFAIFATIEDRDLFLNPPKKAPPAEPEVVLTPDEPGVLVEEPMKAE